MIELRFRIRHVKNYVFAIRWIIAYVVLHNILLDIQNLWNENDEWWTLEKEETHEKKIKQLNEKQINEKLIKKDHVKRLIQKEDDD